METQINPIITLIPLFVVGVLFAIFGVLISKKKVISINGYSFPKVWPGYVLAVLFLIFNIGEVIISPQTSQQKYSGWSILIGFSGLIYWCICVYKLHKTILFITDSHYPIKPGQAVGYHFILFYNVYWIFKWPGEVVNMVNKRMNSSKFKPWVPGLGLFMATLLSRTGGGFIWLLGYFAVISYLVRAIKISLATNSEPIPYSDRSAPVSVGVKVLITCVVSFVILALLSAIALPTLVKARQRTMQMENSRTQ